MLYMTVQDAYEPEEQELLQWLQSGLDGPGPPTLLRSRGAPLTAPASLMTGSLSSQWLVAPA